jgi:hypothetical protein
MHSGMILDFFLVAWVLFFVVVGRPTAFLEECSEETIFLNLIIDRFTTTKTKLNLLSTLTNFNNWD